MHNLDDAYDAYVESVCEYEIPMSKRQFLKMIEEWQEMPNKVSPELKEGIEWN